jgi:hypothetical protein
MDQDVDFSEAFARFLDASFGVRELGEVAQDQFAAASQAGDRSLGLGRVFVLSSSGDCDRGAPSRQGDCGGGSDAAGSAGDQTHFAIHIHLVSFSFRVLRKD